ncbi:MAG: TonB-dependent receptor plug domain-containing protein, partial [Bacteroidales bacterium]|nr:TonB-dependent receptor plug domain-containing protein [Bacteroidales bacterium]
MKNRKKTYLKISIIALELFLSFFLSLPDTYGQFNGRLTDAETGYPLEFASIQSEPAEIAVLSGPDGFFSIPENGKDSLNVIISHLGYSAGTFILHKDLFSNIRLLPDYNQIGEVIVTATHFNSSLQSGAGSISLITQELINHNLSPTLTGIINQVPGIFMADGTLSTNRLTIRGIGSRNPYGTSKIRIYLDEIPVNLVDGTSSPENINPDIIERIEILKGPSSAVFGAGLGGTVIIKPKFPVQEGFNAGYKASFGSWSTYSNSADISMKKNNTSFTLTGKSLRTEGFRENSDLKRKDFFLGFDHLMDKGKVRFLLNYLDFRGGIPSSINEDDYLENPEKAAASWLGVKGFEDTRNMNGGISFDYSLTNKLNTRALLFFGYGDLYESRPFNIFDSRHYNIGVRQSLDFKATWMELKVGYEAINEYTGWEIFQTNTGVRGDRLNALKDKRSYFSGFIHSEITYIPRLRIEPGLSLTVVSYQLYDKFENAEDLSGRYNYKPELSPRLGLNYQAGQSRFVYASLGHGFS